MTDLELSIDWYTRFFGRPPDMRAGDEILWDLADHATLFIEPNPAQAGAGRITLGVTGLAALLERLAAQGIDHEPIETYSNGSATRRSRIQMATRSPRRPKTHDGGGDQTVHSSPSG